MKNSIIKSIILASILSFFAIVSAQAATWKEDGATCHNTPSGGVQCVHNKNQNGNRSNHPAYYSNQHGMKKVCYKDRYGNPVCKSSCKNGNLC